MKKLRKVAVSQRVDVWADRGERRDALDQNLFRWLVAAGSMPFPVPNALVADGVLHQWLIEIDPDAIPARGLAATEAIVQAGTPSL